VADTIAGVFVPGVVAIAGLVFAAWAGAGAAGWLRPSDLPPSLHGSFWLAAMLRAISVLVRVMRG
jgi:cation transport ATPase